MQVPKIQLTPFDIITPFVNSVDLWEACYYHVQLQRGLLGQISKDFEHVCKLDKSVITEETCRNCAKIQVHEYTSAAESIIYEKKSWEPPRDINGYQRDVNDAWKFTSLWPSCINRAKETKTNPNCECIDIIMTCKNPQCQYSDKVVTHLNCQECPHRIERKCNV